jgi:hypothetical protein
VLGDGKKNVTLVFQWHAIEICACHFIRALYFFISKGNIWVHLITFKVLLDVNIVGFYVTAIVVKSAYLGTKLTRSWHNWCKKLGKIISDAWFFHCCWSFYFPEEYVIFILIVSFICSFVHSKIFIEHWLCLMLVIQRSLT